LPKSPRVQALLPRARECERKALDASLPDVREVYRQLARQWRQLARQAEQIEREATPKKGPSVGNPIMRAVNLTSLCHARVMSEPPKPPRRLPDLLALLGGRDEIGPTDIDRFARKAGETIARARVSIRARRAKRRGKEE
jgi:hypothetical protein